MSSLPLAASPGLKRPPYPPAKMSKRRPRFKFPRSLVYPFVRPFVEWNDRGRLGTNRLRRHVVVCGFPRSGTTLFQAMIEACVADIRTFGHERRALEAAQTTWRTHEIMMTKRPLDIFCLDDIRAYYTERQSDVRFVLIGRDPRAVLTSFHERKPGRYFLTVERWRPLYEHWKWARHAPDTLAVRYEDMVGDTQSVQDRLAEFVGWNVARPFTEFHTSMPTKFQTIALNGVRPVDPKNVDKWRADKHRERIRHVLGELPELPERLIEMGYETDDRWVSTYADSRIAAAA